jgi:hypothetical protein
MRTFTAALIATTLVVSPAFAATGNVSPLASGKPAGAKEAALFGPNGAIIFVGLGVLALGIGMTLGGSNDGVTGPTSTSGLP